MTRGKSLLLTATSFIGSKRSSAVANNSRIMATSAFILLVFLDSNQLVQSQTLNEPVNSNIIFALPWDIANSLRAPLGGPVSLALSVIMACILLFGFLLAPVNYIFGYPPRIYHGYRIPGLFGRSLDIALENYPEFSKSGDYSHYYQLPNNGANNDFNRGIREGLDMADMLVHLVDRVSSARVVFDRDENYLFGEKDFTGRELALWDVNETPGFLDYIFLLVPEEDEMCRQLLVCHAHGFLEFLPETALKLYQLLSKHFVTIPDGYKDAIILGLEDQGACGKVYKGCDKDLFQLFRASVGVIRQNLVKFMPSGTKDTWEMFYAKYILRSKKQHEC